MDIEIIFKIATIGILVAIINQLLKRADKEEYATMISIAGLVIVLLMVLSMITGLFEALRTVLRL